MLAQPVAVLRRGRWAHREHELPPPEQRSARRLPGTHDTIERRDVEMKPNGPEIRGVRVRADRKFKGSFEVRELRVLTSPRGISG
jgi:hypothetical protein